MKIKVSVLMVGLVVVLCTFLLESTPLAVEEWSAEQKEVAEWLEKYAEVTEKGNVDENMTYFHPNFSGWDLAQTPPLFDKGPVDKAFLRKSLEEYYKQFKMIAFEVEPLEIVVQDNFAIVHLNYKETFEDSEGNVTSVPGRWTAGLLKQDNKWTFLSWGWIAIK